MATVTVRTYTFTGVTVATSYRLEVLAVNDRGTAPNNHAAQETATTASAWRYVHTRALGRYDTLISSCLCFTWTHSLQPLPVPNPPALRVVLPRFSNIYLVWTDPGPFVGDILGVQFRYLIDCIPQNDPEQDSGINSYSVSGIKCSAGKTHNISLWARTAAGCGSFSVPVVFTIRPQTFPIKCLHL